MKKFLISILVTLLISSCSVFYTSDRICNTKFTKDRIEIYYLDNGEKVTILLKEDEDWEDAYNRYYRELRKERRMRTTK